jgi:HipA-like protein
MKNFFRALRRHLLPLSTLPTAHDVRGLGALLVCLDDAVIGTLRLEGDTFVFEYDPGYANAPGAVPISAFPDIQKTYRSPTLWPFFAVRLPPTEREDVQAAMKKREIADDDVLRLLAELSRRGVSSPYRFSAAA